MTDTATLSGPAHPWFLHRPQARGHPLAALRHDGLLIVGRGDLARTLCEAIAAHHPSGRPPDLLLLDALPSPDPEAVRRLVEERDARHIVVAEPDVARRQRIVTALLESRLRGVQVENAVELYERLEGKIWLAALDPEWLAFARGFRLTRTYLAAKRAMDLGLATLLLVAAAPLLLVVALAIRLESPGPILYRQERVGHMGRPFVLYKFRSMRTDAERDGPRWASENDDRVTRIGGLLRRSRLDELPQVINVLRGELSFVGPRPERPCFVEVLRRSIPLYDLRHFVTPGITGWAQVRFPYAASIEDSYEKFQYDLHYARAASLRLDIEILARTALVMLTGKGR